MTTPIPTLTGERALELMDEAIARRGADYVYVNPSGLSGPGHGCYYIHRTPDGERWAGCLVAEVLAAHGMPLDELERHENQRARDWLPAVSWVSPDAILVLDVAQAAQDAAVRWGKARSDALLALARHRNEPAGGE